MRVTMKAAVTSAVILGVVSLICSYFTFIGMKEATKIAKDALNESKKMAALSNDVYKQKEIPRLEVYPISVDFYTPASPEVAGQVKIKIGTIIKNLSEANAKGVSLNIETKDWYDHCTNWFNIYKEIKLPIPHIASLSKNSELIYPSYTPDAPSSGKEGYVNQDKPFLVKLILYWRDNNNKDYLYMAIYKLDHSRLVDNIFLYFSQIEAYDSVIDGQKAWDYAKLDLKEYQHT